MCDRTKYTNTGRVYQKCIPEDIDGPLFIGCSEVFAPGCKNRDKKVPSEFGTPEAFSLKNI
jgi:hypothetical protein